MKMICPQPAKTVEIMMAIRRVRFTLMPEALATLRLWPTARNFCPNLVRMMTTLNTHNSPTSTRWYGHAGALHNLRDRRISITQSEVITAKAESATAFFSDIF